MFINQQSRPSLTDQNWPFSACLRDLRPVPTPKISIEEAWPEFLAADKTRDLDEVKPALAKLCEAYLGGDWQAVEKKLRDEKCNTYLLAMVRLNFRLFTHNAYVFSSSRSVNTLFLELKTRLTISHI